MYSEIFDEEDWKYTLTDKIQFGKMYLGAKVWMAVIDSPSYFEYWIKNEWEFAIKDLEYMIPVVRMLRQHGSNINDLPKEKYSEKEIEVYTSIVADIIPNDKEEEKPGQYVTLPLKKDLYIKPQWLKINKERSDLWWE